MFKMDSRLIQYCKDNDFSIDEMDEDYFKAVENSFGYQRHLLAQAVLEFKKELIKLFKGIAIYIINKINNLPR